MMASTILKKIWGRPHKTTVWPEPIWKKVNTSQLLWGGLEESRIRIPLWIKFILMDLFWSGYEVWVSFQRQKLILWRQKNRQQNQLSALAEKNYSLIKGNNFILFWNRASLDRGYGRCLVYRNNKTTMKRYGTQAQGKNLV